MDRVIDELVEIRAKLPFIDRITFDDDAFFTCTEEAIADFSGKYKQHVGLPLDIRGATPSTVTREKLSLLVDAGLTELRMGIQTGSERTKKLYRRHHSNRKIEQCVAMIHEFKDKIPLPRYDIIINNPWDTEDDLRDTLLFFARLPKPYLLNMFSMTFYPGTELYDKAVADGIVTDDLEDVYRSSYNVLADGTSGRLVNETYFNNLFYLLYIYSLHGYTLSTKTWMLLIDRKANPLRSQLMYSILRIRASLLPKKRLIRQALASLEKGGTWYEDDYALD